MTEEKSNEAENKTEKKKNRIIEVIAILVLIAGVIWMASIFFDFSSGINTNNAQVDADIASVTSRVSAYIKEIRFKEFENVHAGDTIVLLDDTEFLIKVAQSEADYEIAKANLASIQQAVITSRSTQASTEARLKGNAANLEKAEKKLQAF